MKYLIILANGLTDEPLPERDNKTPLQLAATPHLDRLTQSGVTGAVRTVPEALPAVNEVSWLSLLGYEPERTPAGAAQFVAAALGVTLAPGEIPLCCDFVTLQSAHTDMVMKNNALDTLADAEARLLLSALQEQIVDAAVRFYPGAGGRHLLVYGSEPITERLTPPDELIGEGIRAFMPPGAEGKKLAHLINQAQIILHHHALNKKLRKEGRDLVNSIWLWGNGAKPELPPFAARYGKKGAVVAVSPLLRGIGICAGMEAAPAGTDATARAEAALRALEHYDVVFLEAAAAEKLSLRGLFDDKIAAIEDFDRRVLGGVLPPLRGQNDVKIAVVTGHLCSTRRMKCVNTPAPFAVCPPARKADAAVRFDEGLAAAGATPFASGPEWLAALFNGEL